MIEDLGNDIENDVLAPGHHVAVFASFTWDADDESVED